MATRKPWYLVKSRRHHDGYYMGWAIVSSLDGKQWAALYGEPPVTVETAPTFDAVLDKIRRAERVNSRRAPRPTARGHVANPRRRVNRARYERVVDRLAVKFFQGFADDIRYIRAADGNKYSHVVETDAAEIYLCEHPEYGHCILIVDPSGRTPLWK